MNYVITLQEWVASFHSRCWNRFCSREVRAEHGRSFWDWFLMTQHFIIYWGRYWKSTYNWVYIKQSSMVAWNTCCLHQLSIEKSCAWRPSIGFYLEVASRSSCWFQLILKYCRKNLFVFTLGWWVCTVTISAFLHLWLTLSWPLLTSYLLKRNISKTIRLCDKSKKKQTAERPLVVDDLLLAVEATQIERSLGPSIHPRLVTRRQDTGIGLQGCLNLVWSQVLGLFAEWFAMWYV